MKTTIGQSVVSVPVPAQRISRVSFRVGKRYRLGKRYTKLRRLVDQDWERFASTRTGQLVRGFPVYWRPAGDDRIEIWPEPDREYELALEGFVEAKDVTANWRLSRS